MHLRRKTTWAFISICLYCCLGCSRREPVVATISHRESITLQAFQEDFSKGKTPDTLKSVMQKEIRDKLNPLFKIFDVVPTRTLPRTASNKIMRRKLRENYLRSCSAKGITNKKHL